MMGVFVSILAILVSIWVLLQFAPRVRLDLDQEWIDVKAGLVKVKVTIENLSQGRLAKRTILLQVLSYPAESAPLLSESVPFNTEKVISGQEPLEWHEPQEICHGTGYFYPGEVKTVEMVFRVPNEEAVLHAGLQFNAAPGPLAALVNRFFTLSDSWTTTRFIVNPGSNRNQL